MYVVLLLLMDGAAEEYRQCLDYYSKITVAAGVCVLMCGSC